MPIIVASAAVLKRNRRDQERAAMLPSYLRVLDRLTEQARAPFMFYQAMRDVMSEAIQFFPNDVKTDIVFPKPYRAVVNHRCSMSPEEMEFTLARGLGVTFYQTSSGVCSRLHQLDSAEYMVVVTPDPVGCRTTFVFNKA